ncbi:Protein CBG20502 [Caenorhabditis briggsae]|uniref:Protein CBG20502 n=1 Tax=Caenorhabditis briggsae TaxID=6238 RepID=A8XXY4_CAEBR|nr:Protein CBG20502 [Caenorhabditis briggsae]CAP37503.2 Protein CBG20502 [Caenorhabditis briggsae]
MPNRISREILKFQIILQKKSSSDYFSESQICFLVFSVGKSRNVSLFSFQSVAVADVGKSERVGKAPKGNR